MLYYVSMNLVYERHHGRVPYTAAAFFFNRSTSSGCFSARHVGRSSWVMNVSAFIAIIDVRFRFWHITTQGAQAHLCP